MTTSKTVPSKITVTPKIAVALGVLALTLSACGNWVSVTDAGQVGITVDSGGRPVIAVMTCSRATPVIQLSEGRKPDDPETQQNVERGSWRASKAFSGTARIALAAPDGWVTEQESGTLQPGTLFVLSGGTVEDEDASLGGASFHLADLARLTPDQVQIEGKVQSLSDFSAYKCQ